MLNAPLAWAIELVPGRADLIEATEGSAGLPRRCDRQSAMEHFRSEKPAEGATVTWRDGFIRTFKRTCRMADWSSLHRT